MTDLTRARAVIEAECGCDSPWCVAYVARALLAKVEAVEALADEYERDARLEGYGGELWSTTAAALRAALSKGDE